MVFGGTLQKNKFNLNTSNKTLQETGEFGTVVNPESIVTTPDGKRVFALQSTSLFNMYVFTLSTAWDVSTATLDSTITFTGAYRDMSTQDGINWYFAGTGSNITKHVASTAWDASTINTTPSESLTTGIGTVYGCFVTGKYLYAGGADDLLELYDISNGLSNGFKIYDFTTPSWPQGIFASDDGNVVFYVNPGDDALYQYNFPSGRVSNASASLTKTYDLSSYMTTPRAVTFDRLTGNRLIIGCNGTNKIYSFDFREFVGPTSYSFTNLTFNSSFSVSSQTTSTQGNSVGGIAFSTTGDKMFVQGRRSNNLFYVFEYNLSTNFDISSATYSQQFQVSGGAAEDIAFSTDGTKMFIPSDGSDDRVYQYNLSTGFDVSTASSGGSFFIGSKEIQIRGVTFSTDGTKMFIIGHNTDRVHEYTLSSPFDLGSTITPSASSYLVSGQESSPESVRFNNDGTRMYITGLSSDAITEYSLSTGFDLSSTIAPTTNTLSTKITADGADERNPKGIAFSSDGSKVYFVGTFQKTVYEYSLSAV